MVEPQNLLPQLGWDSLSVTIFINVAKEYIPYVGDFKFVFGFSPLTVARVWQYVEAYSWVNGSLPIKRKHLLWFFYYNKNKPVNKRSAAAFAHCQHSTFLRHYREVGTILSIVLPQLNLAERFDGWQRVTPSIILDTTRFSIEEPSPHEATYPPMTKSQLRQFRAGHFVKKYGACWKYEIGIHVSRSRILWARGPFRGAENDKTIFNSMLLRLLQPEERVLCDRGYIGAPQVVTLRQGNIHSADEAVLNFHRQKVENLYSRFKDFGICSTRFRGSMADHKKLILVLCQLLNIAFLEDPLRADEVGPPSDLFHNS